MAQVRIVGGRYEVVREIARGGMAIVHEAMHTLSRQRVALKVLFPHIGQDDITRQRFLREVSAPAQIGHEGIVQIFDAGFDEPSGSLFVAMELLEGETLRERLVSRRLSLGEVQHLFDRILAPMAAAHDKGVVHRDLKPENIFLAQRGGRELAKILDFGIARDLDGRSENVTHTGVAMGTPHYMAPEQAMSARGAGPQADVWALGVMLYEALSGRTPFAGETASAIVVHACTTPHQPVGALSPDTPVAVAALVDRCLAKKPEDRPKDAGALQADLALAFDPSRLPKTSEITATPRPMDAYAPTAAMPVTTEHQVMGAKTVPTPTATPSQGAIAPPARSPAPRESEAWQSGPGLDSATSDEAWQSGPGVPVVAVAAKSGGGGKLPLLLAAGAALFVVLSASVAGLLYWGSQDSGDLDGPTGLVRVLGNTPGGELFVDGASRGPVGGGREFALSPGDHQLELRRGGAVVSHATVRVAAGTHQQVDLTPAAGAGGGLAGMMPASQTLRGELTPQDSQLPTGEWSDVHAFQWTVGQTVHLEARSTTFDTYLIVRAPSGAQRDVDDVQGQNNASIDYVASEAGPHRVTVTSSRPGEMGAYELVVR